MFLSETLYWIYSSIMVLACILNLFPNYHIAMYGLIFTYLYIVTLTLRHRNFSLYQIFLVTFFLFLLSRIFLTAFGLFDFTHFNLYQNIVIDDNVALTMIYVLHIFLIGTSFAWLQSIKQHIPQPVEYRNRQPYISKGINSMISYLFYIFILISCFRFLFMISYVFEHGYLSIFNGTLSLAQPFFFKGTFMITEFLFLLLIYYNRDAALFKKYSALLFFVYCIRILAGQRGYTLTFLLFLFYMWSTYYKEIKLLSLKVISLILSLPIIIQFLSIFRSSYSFSSFDSLFSNNIFISMLKSQGVSLEVLGDVIMYKDYLLNKVPFIAGYFVDLFQKEPLGQVIEDITHGNYLGDHLTYFINPQLFFMGNGTGTSILAETYELCDGNLILIFLLAFLMTKFVLFLASRSYTSLYLFCISYYILKNFIYSPRDSLFKHLLSIILVTIGVSIFFLFNFLLTFNKQRLAYKKPSSSV